jgi:mycothiol synthase
MGKTGGESMKEPRRYRDEHDLEAMRNLLMAGRKADNGTYYIHTGDLSWWLYYPPLEGDFWDQIYLWDDPAQPGRLLGWTLLSPHWVGFDVFIQPELRGSEIAMDMYLWSEKQAEKIARAKGKPTVSLWMSREDEIIVNHCIKRGYRLKPDNVHLARPLDEPIPASLIPDGFTVRSCKGEPEVEIRSKAQYSSFDSSAPFDCYLERFTNFMRSPVYNPEFDIVAVAPSGQFGAFCIVWTDQTNRVGLFEPVGTHSDFQRKGLGKAVMQEGLRRLQEHKMRSAIVSTNENNDAAIKLYESVGFQVVNRFDTYEKDV